MTAPKEKFDATKYFLDKKTDVENASEVLKTIAHPLRLQVLCLLASEPLSVNEIYAAVGTTQSNVSQHLEAMRNRSLVVRTRQANRNIYKLSNPEIVRLVDLIYELFFS